MARESLQRLVAGLGQDFQEVLLLEVGAGDVELADLFGDDRFLSLDLEVKFDVGLQVDLDWLRAGLLACGLELSDQLLAVLEADETDNEVVAEVDAALALFLELCSVGGQLGEIQGRGIVV